MSLLCIRNRLEARDIAEILTNRKRILYTKYPSLLLCGKENNLFIKMYFNLFVYFIFIYYLLGIDTRTENNRAYEVSVGGMKSAQEFSLVEAIE